MNERPERTAAFSLVEVTFALGLCAFCLIAIFALLPVGMKSNQTAAEQTAANGILSAVTADLRATPQTRPPGGAAITPQYQIPLPASPVGKVSAAVTLYFAADGTFSASRTSDSRYLFSAVFLPNPAPGDTARTATLARLQVSWPAEAAPGAAAGSVQTFVALDRS